MFAQAPGSGMAYFQPTTHDWLSEARQNFDISGALPVKRGDIHKINRFDR